MHANGMSRARSSHLTLDCGLRARPGVRSGGTPDSLPDRIGPRFARLATERCCRDLRAVRFGLWFAAIETALLVAWLVWTSGRNVLPEMSQLSDAWLVLPVAVPIVIVGWLLRGRSRARAELAELEAVYRAFDDE